MAVVQACCSRACRDGFPADSPAAAQAATAAVQAAMAAVRAAMAVEQVATAVVQAIA